VIEPRRRAGLALEPRSEVAVELRIEHLERDLFVQQQVPGAVDVAHAAPAEQRDNLVAHAEGGSRCERHGGSSRRKAQQATCRAQTSRDLDDLVQL